MNSFSKSKLNTKQINTLTQYAFGKPADEIIENNFGEFSAIYMIKVADKDVILKVAPEDAIRTLRYEQYSMQTEVEALKIISENTSIPVPKVILYDYRKSLCDSDYFFMKKMNGVNLHSLSSELNSEQKSDLMFQIGTLNRQINKIGFNKFGNLLQVNKQYNEWHTAFMKMFSDILNDGRDADIILPIPYDELDNIIKQHIYACESVLNPQLIHWDLWQGNILVDNYKISSIIDFERALYADVLMEYYFRKHAVDKDFCAGYGIDLSSLDKNAEIRLALYDLYLSLIWVIEYYYRKYDKSQYSWREERLVSAYKAFNNF